MTAEGIIEFARRADDWIRRHRLLTIAIIFCFVYASFATAHRLTYSDPSYVCCDMARDLEDKIERCGIPVTIVSGWGNNSGGHCWINIGGLDIDSVWLVPYPEHWRYPNNITEYPDYKVYLLEEYGTQYFMEQWVEGKA